MSAADAACAASGPNVGSLQERVLFDKDLGSCIRAYLSQCVGNDLHSMRLCARGGRCLYTPTRVLACLYKHDPDGLVSLLRCAEERLRELEVTYSQLRVLTTPSLIPVLRNVKQLHIHNDYPDDDYDAVLHLTRIMAAGTFRNLEWFIFVAPKNDGRTLLTDLWRLVLDHCPKLTHVQLHVNIVAPLLAERRAAGLPFLPFVQRVWLEEYSHDNAVAIMELLLETLTVWDFGLMYNDALQVMRRRVEAGKVGAPRMRYISLLSDPSTLSILTCENAAPCLEKLDIHFDFDVNAHRADTLANYKELAKGGIGTNGNLRTLLLTRLDVGDGQALGQAIEAHASIFRGLETLCLIKPVEYYNEGMSTLGRKLFGPHGCPGLKKLVVDGGSMGNAQFVAFIEGAMAGSVAGGTTRLERFLVRANMYAAGAEALVRAMAHEGGGPFSQLRALSMHGQTYFKAGKVERDVVKALIKGAVAANAGNGHDWTRCMTELSLPHEAVVYGIQGDPDLFPSLKKLHVVKREDSYDLITRIKKANKKRQHRIWFGPITDTDMERPTNFYA